MKRFLSGVCMMMLVVPALVFAQTEDPAIKAIEAYIYGSMDDAVKEAAVKEALEKNPGLVNATIDDRPILEWAVDNIGVEGDLGKKSENLAQMLVAKGADVNIKDDDGMPLLTKYAMFARIEPMAFLLKNGADVNAKDKADERTALHWITLLNEMDAEPENIEQFVQAIELLLEHKAEIDAADKRGTTPLHNAAFLGNLKMTELLVAKGANMALKDHDGYNALGAAIARTEENWANDQEKAATQKTIDFLKSKGAQDIRPTE